MNKQPLLSIIIPIYNVEPYLRRCLDTLAVQCTDEHEIIMIDDGSPDNCPDICEEYARYYQNFHMIHQKNGGLSSARNIGLDSAKGRYITFCDPDDFYMPNTISRYTEIAQMGGQILWSVTIISFRMTL